MVPEPNTATKSIMRAIRFIRIVSILKSKVSAIPADRKNAKCGKIFKLYTF